MKNNLSTFFKPQSIAVIGASNDSTKIGNAALTLFTASDLKEVTYKERHNYCIYSQYHK